MCAATFIPILLAALPMATSHVSLEEKSMHPSVLISVPNNAPQLLITCIRSQNYFPQPNAHHTPPPIWVYWKKHHTKKHPVCGPVDISSEIHPQGKERCRGTEELKPSCPVWAKVPELRTKDRSPQLSTDPRAGCSDCQGAFLYSVLRTASNNFCMSNKTNMPS